MLLPCVQPHHVDTAGCLAACRVDAGPDHLVPTLRPFLVAQDSHQPSLQIEDLDAGVAVLRQFEDDGRAGIEGIRLCGAQSGGQDGRRLGHGRDAGHDAQPVREIQIQVVVAGLPDGQAVVTLSRDVHGQPDALARRVGLGDAAGDVTGGVGREGGGGVVEGEAQDAVVAEVVQAEGDGPDRQVHLAELQAVPGREVERAEGAVGIGRQVIRQDRAGGVAGDADPFGLDADIVVRVVGMVAVDEHVVPGARRLERGRQGIGESVLGACGGVVQGQVDIEIAERHDGHGPPPAVGLAAQTDVGEPQAVAVGVQRFAARDVVPATERVLRTGPRHDGAVGQIERCPAVLLAVDVVGLVDLVDRVIDVEVERERVTAAAHLVGVFLPVRLGGLGRDAPQIEDVLPEGAVDQKAIREVAGGGETLVADEVVVIGAVHVAGQLGGQEDGIVRHDLVRRNQRRPPGGLVERQIRGGCEEFDRAADGAARDAGIAIDHEGLLGVVQDVPLERRDAGVVDDGGGRGVGQSAAPEPPALVAAVQAQEVQSGAGVGFEHGHDRALLCLVQAEAPDVQIVVGGQGERILGVEGEFIAQAMRDPIVAVAVVPVDHRDVEVVVEEVVVFDVEEEHVQQARAAVGRRPQGVEAPGVVVAVHLVEPRVVVVGVVQCGDRDGVPFERGRMEEVTVAVLAGRGAVDDVRPAAGRVGRRDVDDGGAVGPDADEVPAVLAAPDVVVLVGLGDRVEGVDVAGEGVQTADVGAHRTLVEDGEFARGGRGGGEALPGAVEVDSHVETARGGIRAGVLAVGVPVELRRADAVAQVAGRHRGVLGDFGDHRSVPAEAVGQRQVDVLRGGRGDQEQDQDRGRQGDYAAIHGRPPASAPCGVEACPRAAGRSAGRSVPRRPWRDPHGRRPERGGSGCSGCRNASAV